jgi:L-ribulose-5-phosphate 3-epimerase UlaE
MTRSGILWTDLFDVFMTTEEKRAIEGMKRAIRRAHALGIRLAGMDGQLLYATRSAYEKGKRVMEGEKAASGGTYSAVAHAVGLDPDNAGTLDQKCYEDSGGW